MGQLGWTRVAIALQGLWDTTGEVLRVEIDGMEPLIIDPSMEAFWWPVPVSDMPVEIPGAQIERQFAFNQPLVGATPGSDLSTLLWHIGINSFPGETAWWLQRRDSYRLLRWPNFTTLAHTPDQVRMTSLLGYAALTVDELAAQAEVETSEARKLINAFSLMRILRSDSPSLPMPRSALQRIAEPEVAAAAPRQGLFRRLRERLRG